MLPGDDTESEDISQWSSSQARPLQPAGRADSRLAGALQMETGAAAALHTVLSAARGH